MRRFLRAPARTSSRFVTRTGSARSSREARAGAAHRAAPARPLSDSTYGSGPGHKTRRRARRCRARIAACGFLGSRSLYRFSLCPLAAVAPAPPAPRMRGANAMRGAGTFQLDWQDDFDAFDFGTGEFRRIPGTETWRSSRRRTPASGRDRLAVADARAHRHDEAVSRGRDALARHAPYGKVASRSVREGIGRGVVAGPDLHALARRRWNELDVEDLGRYADRVQTNVMVYTGPPTTPPVTTSVTPTPTPSGWSPSLRSHRRLPRLHHRVDAGRGRFRIDNEVKRTWSSRIDL